MIASTLSSPTGPRLLERRFLDDFEVNVCRRYFVLLPARTDDGLFSAQLYSTDLSGLSTDVWSCKNVADPVADGSIRESNVS